MLAKGPIRKNLNSDATIRNDRRTPRVLLSQTRLGVVSVGATEIAYARKNRAQAITVEIVHLRAFVTGLENPGK